MSDHLLNSFEPYCSVIQAVFATVFTWLLTAARATPVLLAQRFNQKIMERMLGLAAGVMVAAGTRSPLAPAREVSDWTEIRRLEELTAATVLLPTAALVVPAR